jgi:hypothetical protein
MDSSSKHKSTPSQDAIILATFLLAGVLYAWLLRNYHGQTGILPHYNQFIEFFRNGLQHPTSPFPSFPLWGYSLVIVLFPDFFSRAIFQTLIHSVVLFSIFVCFRHLIASRSLRILLLVLLLTPASFACAPPSQPYSLYADCIIISLLALANSKLICSALLFGIALNFRSEAYLLAPAIAIASILTRALDWKSAAKWLVVIYACMMPWAAYTYYNEGAPRITSSNAGQTLIAGLGILSDNKWGATGSDGDILIQSLLEKNGAAGISSLSSPADKILKAEFFRLIMSDPAEFWRKIKHQLRRVVSEETLAERSSYFALLVYAHDKSDYVTTWVTYIGYLGAPLLAFHGLLMRRPLIYLLNMWVVYSLALFLIGFFISTYSANLFPVLAVNVVLLASAVSGTLRLSDEQTGAFSNG